MANKKDFKALEKRAKAQGWDVVPTRGGHLKWTSPTGGQPYFSSSTPSDSRAIHNLVADLRKRGYEPA